MIAVAAGICLAFLLIHFLLTPDKWWRMRHIPGPTGFPLVGNMFQFIKMGSANFYGMCTVKYGPVFKVWLGRTPILVITDPELIKTAGVKLLNHWFFVPPYIKGRLGQFDSSGLLAAKDEYWGKVRRLWQPAFSPSKLSGYIPLMDQCVLKLVDKLGKVVESRERRGREPCVDMLKELQSMTLQVVGSTAYGVDFRAMEEFSEAEEEEKEKGPLFGKPSFTQPPSSSRGTSSFMHASYGRILVEACKGFFASTSLGGGSIYGRLCIIFPELSWIISIFAQLAPDERLQRQIDARNIILATSEDLVEKWMAKKASQGDSSQPAHSPVAAGSFLDNLLSASQHSGLTNIQISSQAMTFILAGYETTSNALAFTFHLLCTHPEVEAKLIKEVDEWLASLPHKGEPGSGDITPETLSSLKYVDAVINESMRLHPAAPATTRLASKDIQIGPYMVPKGTGIILSLHQGHRGKGYWEDAEEFRPERFLPDDAGPLVEHKAHMPFGVGSRLCVGWRFAMQEAKLVLVRMYSKYRFQLSPGQVPLKVQYGMTASPKGGVHVKVVPRNKQAV